MQCVRPIEEVLADFRRKHSQSENEIDRKHYEVVTQKTPVDGICRASEFEVIHEAPEIAVPEKSPIFAVSESYSIKKSKDRTERGGGSFLRIVAVQTIAAAVITIIGLFIRFSVPETFERISHLLGL
ncbi:MAG: hypothetical protein FWG83_02055 [Oscillospiraceae bacterium]|nr:hypothetical protein [Oscillospiraceae bacterium]